MNDEDRQMLARVADYQFGTGVGEQLFADPGELEVSHTSSGRPRQVHADAGRVVTYGTDGRLRLGLTGGHRLQDALDSGYRVAVGDESEPFVRDGRNTFAKFVQRADAEIRPGDEVLVEHHDGHVLAVGRAELSGAGMLDFETGMAVFVREGAGD
jgi:uncharacterized protein with predicted RNA binding PUA domain